MCVACRSWTRTIPSHPQPGSDPRSTTGDGKVNYRGARELVGRGNVRSVTVQGSENSSRRGRRSFTMGGMPLNDMPWWRWRSNVRSALHMLSDPAFHEDTWLAGGEGY